jgi:hypothetical protein
MPRDLIGKRENASMRALQIIERGRLPPDLDRGGGFVVNKATSPRKARQDD